MSREDLLKQIDDRFSKDGVPTDTMLEGLLYSESMTYWDYIHTDALLGLQVKRTNLPDEMVFIMYHQINELLFKMILWEIDQVAKLEVPPVEKFTKHLMRISRYFDLLAQSFTIMRDGMDVDQ